MRQLSFHQNIYTAALLVGAASLIIWVIFNILVDAYPQPTVGYRQATQSTTATIVEPLDYHYNPQP